MTAIDRLLDIMARLRDPDKGCPWDLGQDFSTIAPHTIEEAYEVADAIEGNDMAALRDELGDLLFQVVFYAQMGRERGVFDFDAIVTAITEKMIRRHPHIFADASIESAAAQTKSWEKLKAEERRARHGTAHEPSALDGVVTGLPALTRALKLQTRAARVGFDWPHVEQVFDKLFEEISELRQAFGEPAQMEMVAEELGDVLFVCANLARHGGVDPESALRKANKKFERRFKRIEELLAENGKRPEDSDLAEMDSLWSQAKAEERRG